MRITIQSTRRLAAIGGPTSATGMVFEGDIDGLAVNVYVASIAPKDPADKERMVGMVLPAVMPDVSAAAPAPPAPAAPPGFENVSGLLDGFIEPEDLNALRPICVSRRGGDPKTPRPHESRKSCAVEIFPDSLGGRGIMRALWVWVAVDAEKNEGIAGHSLGQPVPMPLISDKEGTIKRLRDAAQEIADTTGQRLRLLRFERRVECGVVEPHESHESAKGA